MRTRVAIPLLSLTVACLTLAVLASSVVVQPLGLTVSRELPRGILGVPAEIWAAMANIAIILISVYLLARER
ncbi:MAG: hypothetical protein OEW84_02590 [Aigarchaeota archaeon]|nr:hypothetical protein [Aigarchaeota archaeon]